MELSLLLTLTMLLYYPPLRSQVQSFRPSSAQRTGFPESPSATAPPHRPSPLAEFGESLGGRVRPEMALSLESYRASVFDPSYRRSSNARPSSTASGPAQDAPAYGQLLDQFRPDSPRNSVVSPRRSSISYSPNRQGAAAESPRLSLDQACPQSPRPSLDQACPQSPRDGAESPMASPRDGESYAADGAMKRKGLSATHVAVPPVEIQGIPTNGFTGSIDAAMNPGGTAVGDQLAAATFAESAEAGTKKRPMSALVHHQQHQQIQMPMGQTMQIGGFR